MHLPSPVPAAHRSLTRRLGAVALATAALAATLGLTAATPAQAAPRRLAVADARLVNYYPATHGWTTMWSAWDAAEFERDMVRVARLGGNAVRLIVQPSAFGYPTPTQVMKDRLASAVTLADRHGVSVELTLFDWFSSYTDVAGSKIWASAVLAPYRNDTRVFAVELQNEIPVENVAAVSWAKAMLPHLASRVDSPTTISVNGAPARLASLKTMLGTDGPAFWSYHYYDQLLGAGANSAFATAKALAAPTPLFIGETGVDTVPRIGEDASAALDRQDHFYRAVFTAARAQRLPVPAPWTLNDFTVAGIPGRTALSTEHAFGLLRTDGTEKPAAQTVRAAFSGAVLSTSFNGSFERSSAALPAEWSTYLPEQLTIAVDHAVARSGTSSVQLSASLGDAAGWPSLRTSLVQAIVPGRSYTATAWAKGVDVTGTSRIGLTWYDATGRYLGVTASNPAKLGTSDWHQLTASGVAPAGAAAVLLQLQTTRNTGTVWFDDVTFG